MSARPGSADRLTARTDSEARKRFFHFLGRALHVVAPNGHWKALRMAPGGWSATTMPNAVLKLKMKDGGCLYLRSTIVFDYIDHPERRGERKVTTLAYAHTITEDVEAERELYSWHWGHHPWPHLHVDKGMPEARGTGRLHVPTGRVFLEHVLWFLVHDLGVQPRRDDWEEILSANLGRLSRFASWGKLSDT